jgi:hypothetical protein
MALLAVAVAVAVAAAAARAAVEAAIMYQGKARTVVLKLAIVTTLIRKGPLLLRNCLLSPEL